MQRPLRIGQCQLIACLNYTIGAVNQFAHAETIYTMNYKGNLMLIDQKLHND